jgi:hypothetical protein
VVGDDALDLGKSFIERGVVDIHHQDRSTLLEEENSGFKADAAENNI